MDKHGFGFRIPSNEGAETACSFVAAAFLVLAQRWRERLMGNELSFREQMRVTRKLDCQVQESDGIAVLMPAGVGSELVAIIDERRLELGFEVHTSASSSAE